MGSCPGCAGAFPDVDGPTHPYMESSPDPAHPLRGVITPLVFDACRNYALAIGVERILLRNPLEGVQERYARFGFRLAFTGRGNVYFESRCTE